MESIFQITQPGVFNGCYLAEVTSVSDPDNLGRVKVRLLNADGIDGHDAEVWARVAVPFAGADRGAFFIPDVGDEVLVNFIQGDSRYPVVVGGMWNGSAAPPETLPGDRVDRWTIVGKNGTRIAIEEESGGQEKIILSTPNQTEKMTITAEAGGKVEVLISGHSIKIETSGITIQSSVKLKIDAPQVEVNAPQVNVNAAMSQFTGVVKCDVLQATTVIATTYTPGAGNIW